MKLAQAILFVHDAVRMQAFYEVLGLAVIEGDAGTGFVRMADLTDGRAGAVLALHVAAAAGPAASAPRVDTWTKLCFHVDDVDSARADLEARGVTMREVHRFGAVTFCDGIDPEGNIFQLTTR